MSDDQNKDRVGCSINGKVTVCFGDQVHAWIAQSIAHEPDKSNREREVRALLRFTDKGGS